MDYVTAEEIVTTHRDLVGTHFRNKTISRLLIAPLNEVGIAKLMYNFANEISNAGFYEHYRDFEVWVIFDEEEWLLNGIIDKMRLPKLLAERTD